MVVNLYGDDLARLVDNGKEIEAFSAKSAAAPTSSVDQSSAQPALQFRLDQEQLARHGSRKVVTDVIESIGSKPLGEVLEGQYKFPLVAACRKTIAAARPPSARF